MDKEKIARKARALMDAGHHCSESVLIAVGELLSAGLGEQTIKASIPFAGGIGCAHQEVCGALTGGLMVIGMLHGRTKAGRNDDHCQQLAVTLRERFHQKFGWTKCQDLRDHWIGRPGQENCAVLVEQATQLLLEVLEE